MLLGLLTLTCPRVCGQIEGRRSGQSAVEASQQPAFVSGEELHYEVRFGFAKCAEVRFTTRDTMMGKRRFFHHRIAGHTTGLVGAVYPLHDVYHTYTDPSTDLPVRAVRDVTEQEYLDYKVDLFDRKIRPDSAVITRENGEQVVVALDTHDLVSAAYFVRSRLASMRLTPNSRIEIPTFFNAEYYPLQIRYTGRKMVDTRFGKVECYCFVPLVQEGSLFKEKEAITVYISTDENHVPVRVQFKLFLGSMYCDLVAYRGLASPFYVVR